MPIYGWEVQWTQGWEVKGLLLRLLLSMGLLWLLVLHLLLLCLPLALLLLLLRFLLCCVCKELQELSLPKLVVAKDLDSSQQLLEGIFCCCKVPCRLLLLLLVALAARLDLRLHCSPGLSSLTSLLGRGGTNTLAIYVCAGAALLGWLRAWCLKLQMAAYMPVD